MNAASEAAVEAAVDAGGAMVDVAFGIVEGVLARGQAAALARALQQACPALAQRPDVGVYATRTVVGGASQALPSRRARLVLRVAREDLPAVHTLADSVLHVDGRGGPSNLKLGGAQVRALLPHDTLYSAMVVSEAGSEGAFLSEVEAALKAMGVHARPICGGARALEDGEAVLHGHALMLDQLGRNDALRVLERGLGPRRQLGCGVFVAHRSAAAVGSWM